MHAICVKHFLYTVGQLPVMAIICQNMSMHYFIKKKTLLHLIKFIPNFTYAIGFSDEEQCLSPKVLLSNPWVKIPGHGP
jgi:uncharacterized membrane protein